MKRPIFTIILCVLLIGLAGYLPAQNVSLTLQVDMSQVTVSTQGVHVAGSFQSEAGFGSDWNPASTPLSDPDGDKIYAVTLQIPSGNYEYKFINGNAWGSDESPPVDCSVTPNHNRAVTLGNSDLNLPPVRFNACNAQLTFAINMSDQPVSPQGVHVMGDFQVAAGFSTNWDPTSITLQDLNGDGTYEVTLSVLPGDYQYLFVNGNTAVDGESLPLDCTVEDGSGQRRRTISVAVGSAQNQAIYCYETCEICDPILSTNYTTYWWNDAVFYEIFVRSFYDSNNDGIGDFRGIIEKLDYLNDGDPNTDTDLGVTGLWLMPMMASPSYHGYDVTDYYATEPDYGSMADFEALVEAAHARGIKVIIDFVMNHTSDQHPWFTQSANKQNDFRDWYIWSDNNPGFSGPWGQNVWHARTGDYYYGLFWSGMPDLNYSLPAVRAEMFKITEFWLDKGVDGFRLDAIKYLDEDGTVLENTAETFTLLQEFNDVYKTKNPDAFTVGEVWSNTASIIPYVQNNRLDICFDFDLAGAILNAVNNSNAANIQNQFNIIQGAYPRLQYGTFLTNHDIDRVFSQLGSNAGKMKQAASLYLTMPGVPFIYYGEELGMTGTGAHENIRRPLPWTSGVNGGFSTHSPWQGLGDNFSTNNVATMNGDPNSLLQHYKKLVHIRNAKPALRRGYLLPVPNANNNILSYARVYEEEVVIVLSNFATSAANPAISLPASSLPAGTYQVNELYTGQSMGNVTLDEKGGFFNWSAPGGQTLGNRESWLLSLTANEPTPTSDQFAEALAFTLYPNPAQEEVRLDTAPDFTGKGILNIYDVTGRLQYHSTLSNGQTFIPTVDWSAGLYFVKLQLEGKYKTKPLLISR